MGVEIIRRGVHNWGPLKGQPFVIIGGCGLLFGDDGSGSPVSTIETDYGKLITAHETVHGLKTRPMFWGHDYSNGITM
jgi:hypothetical protein